MKKLLVISLYALTSFFLPVSAQNISTMAGNGTKGYSGDGGQATAAELSLTSSVAVNPAGDIYIADETNNRIRMVNTSGIITTIAGNGTPSFSGDGGPATAAEINGPAGVAVDAAGNVYIGDWKNNRIRVINTSGTISTIAGNGTAGYSGDGGQATAAELNAPEGIAVDAAGNVYITDVSNERIRKVNTSGTISTFAGNGTNAYSGDGGQATAAELNFPTGAALDASGNVYIADQDNNRIRMVNTSGIISTFAGNGVTGYSGDGGQATAGEINTPHGVKVDITGNIYIADDGNNCIRKVSTSGIITTIAGNGTASFSGDGGPATAAELFFPHDVAPDASGNIYIADANNYRIREVTKATAGVNRITNADNGVVLYPNPSNGIFTMEVKGDILTKSVLEIYTLPGKKIHSTPVSNPNTQISINLGPQPAGIYLYRIITETGNVVNTGRFIIQK